MQTSQSHQSSVQSFARFALSQPNAAMRELMALTKEERDAQLQELRVYPASLIALYRADNSPRDVKIIIEGELETVGFQILT